MIKWLLVYPSPLLSCQSWFLQFEETTTKLFYVGWLRGREEDAPCLLECGVPPQTKRGLRNYKVGQSKLKHLPSKWIAFGEV